MPKPSKDDEPEVKKKKTVIKEKAIEEPSRPVCFIEKSNGVKVPVNNDKHIINGESTDFGLKNPSSPPSAK